MSRTTVYAAPESGPLVAVSEHHNAWGSAAYVWSSISLKLFGDRAHWMLLGPSEAKQQSFWDLAHDERRLNEDERIVFAWTFDACLVRRADFPRLAGCFRRFVAAHPSDGACNLPAFAELLERFADDAHGMPFVPHYVGWHQTSVSDNPWRVRTGEDGEGRAYNPSADEGHFILFHDEAE